MNRTPIVLAAAVLGFALILDFTVGDGLACAERDGRPKTKAAPPPEVARTARVGRLVDLANVDGPEAADVSIAVIDDELRLYAASSVAVAGLSALADDGRPLGRWALERVDGETAFVGERSPLASRTPIPRLDGGEVVALSTTGFADDGGGRPVWLAEHGAGRERVFVTPDDLAEAPEFVSFEAPATAPRLELSLVVGESFEDYLDRMVVTQLGDEPLAGTVALLTYDHQGLLKEHCREAFELGGTNRGSRRFVAFDVRALVGGRVAIASRPVVRFDLVDGSAFGIAPWGTGARDH